MDKRGVKRVPHRIPLELALLDSDAAHVLALKEIKGGVAAMKCKIIKLEAMVRALCGTLGLPIPEDVAPRPPVDPPHDAIVYLNAVVAVSNANEALRAQIVSLKKQLADASAMPPPPPPKRRQTGQGSADIAD